MKIGQEKKKHEWIRIPLATVSGISEYKRENALVQHSEVFIIIVALDITIYRIFSDARRLLQSLCSQRWRTPSTYLIKCGTWRDNKRGCGQKSTVYLVQDGSDGLWNRGTSPFFAVTFPTDLIWISGWWVVVDESANTICTSSRDRILKTWKNTDPKCYS